MAGYTLARALNCTLKVAALYQMLELMVPPMEVAAFVLLGQFVNFQRGSLYRATRPGEGPGSMFREPRSFETKQ